MTVSVVNPNGEPIGGVTVSELKGCCPEGDCVRVTGSDGRVNFRGQALTAGDCEVRVEKAGFATINKPYSYTCDTSKNVSLAVTLAP